MSSPMKNTRPLSGVSRPVTKLKNVVLPDPLGPIRPTTVRGSIVKPRSFTAVIPPNRFVRPRTSSIGVPAGSWTARIPLSDTPMPPREGIAACSARLRDAVVREAGMSPSRRYSIISTRMIPKISSIVWTSSTCWSPSLPTSRPRACTHCVRSCRNQDCRSCRISAPRTTPGTLPMPPSTTITSTITDTGNWNMSGVAVPSFAT